MIKVSALIVTRGNLSFEELQQVCNPLRCFDDIVIWDNSEKVIDFKPLGLYLAADQAENDILYIQDDDCIVSSPADIVKAWHPGRIVCNMSKDHQAQYISKPDKLMGFGSVFERSLIRPTFERYFKHFPIDAVSLREPNRIFTALNSNLIDIVDVPITHMPYASDEYRLWKQPDHGVMRDASYRRIDVVLKEESYAKSN